MLGRRGGGVRVRRQKTKVSGRRGGAVERARTRRSFVERLETRLALAAFTPGNLLVSSAPFNGEPTLYEYAPEGGSPVQTVAIENPTRVATERPRDLVYDANGDVQIYNGTFDPRLTTYDPVAGTFEHARFPSWTTGNAVSYGGLAALDDVVFASDMRVRAENATQRGVVRFSVDNLSSGWSREANPDIGDSSLNTATTIPHITVSGTGDGSFDYYSFTVPAAGARGIFDIDYGDTGLSGSFFSYLRLYDVNQNVLSESGVVSDVLAGSGGSTSTRDAYLEYTFPAAGTYVIEVGACCGPTGVPAGSTYELQISVEGHSEYILGGSGQLVDNEPNDTLFSPQNTDSGERFGAANGDVADVAVGLDGLLYALVYTGDSSGAANEVNVYDPSTFALLRTVTLPFVHRGIAVDASGSIYATFPEIYKYSPTGVPLGVIKNPAGGILGDIDIKSASCFAGTASDGCIAVASTNGSIILTNPSFTDIDFFSARQGDGTTFVAFVADPLSLPHATDDLYRIAEDTNGNTLNVLINDLVDSRGTLVITAATAGSQGGAVTISGGASLRYTPAANFSGQESFTYTVVDGLGGSATASVTVDVTNVNEPPTVVDDLYSVAEDSGSTTFSPLDNDSALPDVGETLTILSVGAPNHGGAATLNANKTTVQYQPAADFAGDETFTYVVSDGNGATSTGTVTVSVVNSNDPPTAVNDNLAVNPNTTNNPLDVLANDSDAPDSGETLSIFSVGAAAHGTTSIFGSLVRYTPNSGYRGVDTFSYVLRDSNGGQATATVTVTVDDINNPPVVTDDAYDINRNSQNNNLPVLANDTTLPDVGETLRIVAVTIPNHGGQVSIVNNGATLRYTPPSGYSGTELFQYTAADSRGAEATGNVQITVGQFNSTPVPENDQYSVEQNSIGNVLQVLVNDFDPDFNVLTIVATGSTSSGGTVTIAADGKSLTYAPPRPFLGVETFSYTVSDGAGGTAAATVSVEVLGWQNPNDPLDVNDDTHVAPDDANILITELNAPTFIAADGKLPLAPPNPEFYYDCNGDGYLSPADPLLVINALNFAAGGEGEAAPSDSIDVFAPLAAESLVAWPTPVSQPTNRLTSSPEVAAAWAPANVVRPTSVSPLESLAADQADAWSDLIDELAAELAALEAKLG